LEVFLVPLEAIGDLMAGGWRFHKKLRKCNNCGFEHEGYYNTHKVWCKKKKAFTADLCG
jgi:hypothetical protein